MAVKKVLILYGGRSTEHEVSLQSAKNVLDALDRSLWEPVLAGIGKDGVWRLGSLPAKTAAGLSIDSGAVPVTFAPCGASRDAALVSLDSARPFREHIDVVFPVLHGPFGEDGSVQGLFRMAAVPFVGSGVAGSACGMDKELFKRLIKEAGIPSCKYEILKKNEKFPLWDDISARLGRVIFVKPASQGSSVGITRVTSPLEWEKALELAFKFDNKLILEEGVSGRELECAVLETKNEIRTTPLGEIKPEGGHDFYDYDAKYIDENGAALVIPAPLPPETEVAMREAAKKAFAACGANGLARMDFFLREEAGSAGQYVVNEVNTMPGFTRISMYPKLWEYEGVSYSELVSLLLENALERFAAEENLRTSYS
jgi:D-alanine-D-alanine ligase